MTAFITPFGLYEWIRVPFGLTNVPAEFQGFMENALFDDMRNEFAVPYFDDTLVFSDTFDDHLNHLIFFQRPREKGITIKASKYKLFQRQIKYLGRIISSDGYQIDQANIKAVTDLLNQ